MNDALTIADSIEEFCGGSIAPSDPVGLLRTAATMLRSQNTDIVMLQKRAERDLEDLATLEALRRGGVDNWDWYGDSLDARDEILAEMKRERAAQ